MEWKQQQFVEVNSGDFLMHLGNFLASGGVVNDASNADTGVTVYSDPMLASIDSRFVIGYERHTDTEDKYFIFVGLIKAP